MVNHVAKSRRCGGLTCSVGGVSESVDVDILKLVALVQRASAVRTKFKTLGTKPKPSTQTAPANSSHHIKIPLKSATSSTHSHTDAL